MRNLEDNTLLLLVIAVSLASAWILLPFYEAVLWATVLAVVFAPLYRRLSSSMGQQHSLAALATTVLKDFLLDACDPLGARLSRGL
jgi:predicted PurR-regulated permease PerM